MRNKVLLCGFVIVIMAFITAFGYTNARYYSAASMTGETDGIKAIGRISIYHPEWVFGYSGADDGSGVFDVSMVPIEYGNIHYRVTNKINDEINNENVSYYIRVTAEDGSHNIPIEYDVHEYNNPGHVLPFETGTGYGPLTLGVDSEEEVYYSIRANWVSTDIKYLAYVQHLKVQMVTKRLDGTLKVMDEAPLNMQYSGSEKVKVTFAYHIYGTDDSVGEPQTINMRDNFIINFNDNTQLAELGIVLPVGYTFHDVRYNINGFNEDSGTAATVTIPEGPCIEGYHIDVYLTSTYASVQLAYYDYTAPVTDGEGNTIYKEISSSRQELRITKGTAIDFTDDAQRSSMGIYLPTGYALQGLGGELVTNLYTDTSVTIPDTTEDTTYHIDVYMIPSGSAAVNISYYEAAVEPDKLLSTQTLSNVSVGTVIDFSNPDSLSELGITLPADYTFTVAYCAELDAAGTGGNAFTIPYSGANQTYNINVVLNKPVTAITVPVKFCDSSNTKVSSIAVEMRADGTYEFTTDICRALCPDLSDKTSFTIYVANHWNSAYQVGNTYEAGNAAVIVDYNATYSTSDIIFNLTDEGSYIRIIAWW